MTIEEIKTLKNQLCSQFGKVTEVEVPIDDEGSTATIFLKKPDRNTFSLVSKLITVDSIKAIEGALKNLYVGGDKLEIILNNDDALLSCESVIVELMQKKQAVIKKN